MSELREIHEECGKSIAEHCAFCDTCTCECPTGDTISATTAPAKPYRLVSLTRVGFGHVDEQHDSFNALIVALYSLGVPRNYDILNKMSYEDASIGRVTIWTLSPDA